jgi:hypothetical protein
MNNRLFYFPLAKKKNSGWVSRSLSSKEKPVKTRGSNLIVFFPYDDSNFERLL